MKGKRRASSESNDSDEDGESFDFKRLEAEPVFGDVMWVMRYDDDMWWPAVVADENNISASSKPRNRSKGDVLVRLYGSYKYMYVDPVKCHSEFEITLKQNGGCYHGMFTEALEQDLPQSKSGRSRGKGSNSKGASNGGGSASKDKKSNQNRVNCKIESSNHVGAFPRKQLNSVPSKIGTKENNFLSKVVQDAISKASEQLGSPNTEENSRGETPKQDFIRNKLKRNCTSINEQANYKNHDQEAMQMRLEQNWQSAAVETKSPSLKQDEVQEKHELSPSSVGGTFFGRLQELRARKTKVMQNLGLAAPSGSPFN